MKTEDGGQRQLDPRHLRRAQPLDQALLATIHRGRYAMAFRQAVIARPATVAGLRHRAKSCTVHSVIDSKNMTTMTIVRKTYIRRTSAIATMTRTPYFQ